MARTFHRRERLEGVSEINVTPLIDLAFALLIIFMITAPLLEQQIDVELPTEAPKAQPEPTDDPAQAISIDAEGQIFWSDQPVSPARLSDLLAEAAARPTPPVIHVRADSSLPYQAVITVIDLVKQNNLTKLSLDTRAE